MDEDFQDPFHLQIALRGVDMWLLPYQQHLENQEVLGDKEPPSNLDQSPTQPWHLPALLGHPTEARPGPSSDSGPSIAGGQVMWGGGSLGSEDHTRVANRSPRGHVAVP